MDLLERYLTAVKAKQLYADPEQEKVITCLQSIYDKLVQEDQQSQGWWSRIKKSYHHKYALVQGLYLWGGVGIGKTYLLDLFYDALPFSEKLRIHFHDFMRIIHERLYDAEGVINPLQHVAKGIAKQYRVICFDEFFVNDVGDAIILANLLHALFDRGICLVITSNLHPDDLYHNGVQRELFLPAIDLLHRYLHCYHLAIVQDYRQRSLTAASLYFFPLSELNDEKMQETFTMLAKNPGKQMPILINNRYIETIAWADQVIWFDFSVICNMPRSQHDYLAIAEQFSYVLVSNVTKIPKEKDNIAIYFINLVDILYDKRVKLIIHAAAPVTDLYLAGRKAFEFERTKSRLLEMQTEEYLSLPHRAIIKQ